MAALLTKRYRLTFDVDVVVEDITIEQSIRRNPPFYETHVTEDWYIEKIAGQQRLLRVVLSNPTFLEAFTREHIADAVAKFSVDDLYAYLGGRVSEAADFAPLLAHLSEEDQSFFAESEAEDLWFESIELLYRSFITAIREVTMTELPIEPESLLTNTA